MDLSIARSAPLPVRRERAWTSADLRVGCKDGESS
jgi:hypothetical protein